MPRACYSPDSGSGRLGSSTRAKLLGLMGAGRRSHTHRLPRLHHYLRSSPICSASAMPRAAPQMMIPAGTTSRRSRNLRQCLGSERRGLERDHGRVGDVLRELRRTATVWSVKVEAPFAEELRTDPT